MQAVVWQMKMSEKSSAGGFDTDHTEQCVSIWHTQTSTLSAHSHRKSWCHFFQRRFFFFTFALSKWRMCNKSEEAHVLHKWNDDCDFANPATKCRYILWHRCSSISTFILLSMCFITNFNVQQHCTALQMKKLRDGASLGDVLGHLKIVSCAHEHSECTERTNVQFEIVSLTAKNLYCSMWWELLTNISGDVFNLIV